MFQTVEFKRCCACSETKPASEFYFDAARCRLSSRCKPCARKQAMAKYVAHPRDTNGNGPEYVRLKHELKEYGLTIDQFRGMEDVQNKSCAACGGPQQFPKKRLCVDHDHTTGKVRGLLCDRCNRALGLVRDSKELLASLSRYLCS